MLVVALPDDVVVGHTPEPRAESDPEVVVGTPALPEGGVSSEPALVEGGGVGAIDGAEVEAGEESSGDEEGAEVTDEAATEEVGDGRGGGGV